MPYLILKDRYYIGEFILFLQSSGYIQARSDCVDFISYVTDHAYADIPLKLNSQIVITEKIKRLLKRLKSGYPVAYITNRRHFYGKEYYVDERVLIPRYETEFLMQKVLEISGNKPLSILDLCTGSGILIISLLGNKKGSTGLGVDINLSALQVASYNAKKHKISERVHFVCGDALIADRLIKERFDIIVCNPPYVSKTSSYGKSILFEPHLALFAQDEGFSFYKKLLPLINKLCKRGGFAFFEFGMDQDKRLYDYALDLGITTEFAQDLSGKNRVLFWKN